MKKCSTCKTEKQLSDFGKDRSRADSLRTYCKQCAKLHRAKSGDKAATWRAARREQTREYNSNYYAENKELLLAKCKAYRHANADKVSAGRKKHYLENRERVLSAARNYAQENPEKIREYKRNWTAIAKQSRPEFALAVRYRKRVRMAVKKSGIKLGGRTHLLLGCDWAHLKQHLESMFYDGMSWDNLDEWHIDHVIPLCSARTSEEIARLCHYTNLQPLWAIDNLIKGRSMPCHLKKSA